MSRRWLLTLALVFEATTARAAVPVLHEVGALKAAIVEAGRGGHPVIVHFFALWCNDCMRELPTIQAAAERVRAQGAAVIFVSLDPPGKAADVERFLRSHRVEATAYLLDVPTPDPITAAIDPSWEASLPATFLFRDGQRVASFLGPLHHVDDLVKALDVPRSK